MAQLRLGLIAVVALCCVLLCVSFSGRHALCTSRWLEHTRAHTSRREASLFMGRRSAKIANRKGAADAKKAKIYARIGKRIVMVRVYCRTRYRVEQPHCRLSKLVGLTLWRIERLLMS
jgi:hypothetical protein